ncbi:UNVERIFIED_CONTAM: hypothetical protein RMT77_012716 [Armadillidium vulgare]
MNIHSARIIYNSLSSLTKKVSFINTKSVWNIVEGYHINKINKVCVAALFHTNTTLRNSKGLYEFFDNKENWGATEVKVGRSWRKEELRLKSNEDLHKLWYVLLKEKNMLLTMEDACKREYRLFPNPERIDKVEESMTNLEAVVRERDDAYLLLEAGEKSGRPSSVVTDGFGRTLKRKHKEFTVPDYMHLRVKNSPFNRNPIRTRFSRLLREKERRISDYYLKKQYDYVCRILSTFGDVDLEDLKAKFPDVDIEKARNDPKSRGQHDNNYG